MFNLHSRHLPISHTLYSLLDGYCVLPIVQTANGGRHSRCQGEHPNRAAINYGNSPLDGRASLAQQQATQYDASPTHHYDAIYTEVYLIIPLIRLQTASEMEYKVGMRVSTD